MNHSVSKVNQSEVFEMESHYPIIVSVHQTNESDVLFLQSDLGTLPSSTKTFNFGQFYKHNRG